MAVKQFLGGVNQLFVQNGSASLAGGTIDFHEPGTSTDKDTYTTSDLTTANANPVVLDANGRPTVGIWLSGDYDVIVSDSDGNVIYTEDNINPDTEVVAEFFPTWIGGLDLSLDADTDHDINITAGTAVDSASAVFITLAEEITKQIDVPWAAGNDNGGLFSGSVAANTLYYIHLIRNPNTDTVDAGFDTSITAANIPSGYTQFRQIGSLETDASSNIISIAGADESNRTSNAATDHALALREYRYNGSTVQSDLSLLPLLVASTYESFGRTGSGATNEWDAMDEMSPDATHVIVMLDLQGDSSAAAGTLTIYARPGNTTWAVIQEAAVATVRGENLADLRSITEVAIPLDPSDGTFDLAFTSTNVNNDDAFMVYRGFKA